MKQINKYFLIFFLLIFFNNAPYNQDTCMEKLIQKQLISSGKNLHKFFINTKERIVDFFSNLWNHHKWAISATTLAAAVGGILAYKKYNKATKEVESNKTAQKKIVYVSRAYLDSIQTLRIMDNDLFNSQNINHSNFLKAINNTYAPIKFQENTNPDETSIITHHQDTINRTEAPDSIKLDNDKRFNDVILAMIAIHDIMELIKNKYNMHQQINDVNYFTLLLYFDIIEYIETHITKIINDNKNNQSNKWQSLITQIKNNFYVFHLQKYTYVTKDYIKSPTFAFKSNDAIVLPKETEEPTVLKFFYKNNIYKEILKKEEHALPKSAIMHYKFNYERYKKDIISDLKNQGNISDLIKLIKEKQADWIKNNMAQKSFIKNIKHQEQIAKSTGDDIKHKLVVAFIKEYFDTDSDNEIL
jgi:hypothetical protein